MTDLAGDARGRRGAESRSNPRYDGAVVEVLLTQDGLLDGVLDEHVDDGSGYCRVCPGPESGRSRFPCDVRHIADRAARIRRA